MPGQSSRCLQPGWSSDDGRRQLAEALDREGDRVAGLEVAPEARRLADLSSRQPVPTVPEPIRSPGTSRASDDARASISPNENWMSDHVPRLSSVPLTLAVAASA